MSLLRLVFYACLGLLPSLVWLSFYIKKDKHREPNSIILKLFAYGILVAPLAIIAELFLVWIAHPGTHFLSAINPTFENNGILGVLLVAALIPAFSEEYLKYAMVKFRFLRDIEFDEPTDVMIYCIVVGLGFAAIENLVILFRISFPSFGQALTVMSLRFLGATLVHALACGVIGYWLARGILHAKQRKQFILTGLLIAMVFHASYNYLIMSIYSAKEASHELLLIFAISILLISVAALVSNYFRKLKNQLSVCLPIRNK